jgi:hypothetical protein
MQETICARAFLAFIGTLEWVVVAFIVSLFFITEFVVVLLCFDPGSTGQTESFHEIWVFLKVAVSLLLGDSISDEMVSVLGLPFRLPVFVDGLELFRWFKLSIPYFDIRVSCHVAFFLF